MDQHEQIWNLAKFRFVQSEASLWVISNKVLEVAWFASISCWVYFEFFSGNYTYLKFIGLIIIYLSFGEIRSRIGSYRGYFDGYEKGFEDAATRNCDYWGKTHDEYDDQVAIKSVLDDIKKNEDRIDKKNLDMRDSEIIEGFSRLTGYILTWRKIK